MIFNNDCTPFAENLTSNDKEALRILSEYFEKTAEGVLRKRKK